jgi:hypothetical protein
MAPAREGCQKSTGKPGCVRSPAIGRPIRRDVGEEVTHSAKLVARGGLEPVPERARLQVDVEQHGDQGVFKLGTTTMS